MTGWGTLSRIRARLAWLPWLSLSFLLTGCPLTDHYSIQASAGGGAGTSTGGGGGGDTATTGGASGPGAGADAGGSSAGGSSAGAGGSSAAASGAAGVSGSAGAASCSALTCSDTCCAAPPGGVMACVDTTRDFQNCGACGTVCNAGRACAASVCAAGWAAMSAPPVGFAARWRAASVAMGKSVFIWGGSDSTGAVLDSGAIYSPVDNTWSLLPKDAETPTARVLATAVWTGSVVIVFGGSDASGATTYNDGAVYDPAQNVWEAIPTATATKARSAALGFWDGTSAVFWGGTTAMPAVAVSGADRFDLSAWTSSSVAGDPGAVLAPASGWDGTKLYLEGGVIAGVRSAQAASYLSSTNTWASLSNATFPAPSARSNAFGVWDGGQGFVVWGGRDDAAALHTDGKFLLSGAWYPTSTVGVPSARMLVPRRHGWVFSTGVAVIALLGGQNSLAAMGTFSTTGATYDVMAGKWGAIPAWPSGETHDYGVGVWTGDEFVLWGGHNGMGPAQTTTLTGERWKP